MQQYFIEHEANINDIVELNEEQAHHIKTVMRMKENDVIRIVDSMENAFFAKVIYDGKKVKASLTDISDKKCENPVEIILLMGLIKKDKWDVCIQKACECGVHTIIPFTSIRSVVHPTDTTDKKVERWNKIAMEACEQCKRNHLVEVMKPMSLKDALKNIQADYKIIAYEDANIKGMSLKKILKTYEDPKKIIICIGVEGGFDPKEVQFAIEQGYDCVSLGGRILRAETAAMSMLSQLCYEYELED